MFATSKMLLYQTTDGILGIIIPFKVMERNKEATDRRRKRNTALSILIEYQNDKETNSMYRLNTE
jgi:hypothetical protein